MAASLSIYHQEPINSSLLLDLLETHLRNQQVNEKMEGGSDRASIVTENVTRVTGCILHSSIPQSGPQRTSW
jgi:hypothetical protein